MIYSPTHTRTGTRTRTRGQRMRRCERRDMKRLFLTAYSAHPVTLTTCESLQISRSTFYAWLTSDKLFKEKYQSLLAACYLPWWGNDTSDLDITQEEIKAFYQRRKAGKRLMRYYAKQATANRVA